MNKTCEEKLKQLKEQLNLAKICIGAQLLLAIAFSLFIVGQCR